jgi:hypothetical protein
MLFVARAPLAGQRLVEFLNLSCSENRQRRSNLSSLSPCSKAEMAGDFRVTEGIEGANVAFKRADPMV